MTVELPKDAEGREIPLDTALLYGKVSGEEYDVVCFSFRPSMRQWRVKLKRRDDLGIYATENFTLSPPDTWEKLFEDLKAVEDYGNSPHRDSPTCHYIHMVGKPCDKCKFHGCVSCVGEMFADIADRIRKLSGDDE